MTEKEHKAENILRWALRGNALFSGVSGVAILWLRDSLAPHLGAPSGGDLVPTGFSLLLFCGWLVWMSSREDIPRRHAFAAVVLDGLWVLGSVVALLGASAVFSPLGFWLVIGVGLVVMLFADLQFYGLYATRTHSY